MSEVLASLLKSSLSTFAQKIFPWAGIYLTVFRLLVISWKNAANPSLCRSKCSKQGRRQHLKQKMIAVLKRGSSPGAGLVHLLRSLPLCARAHTHGHGVRRWVTKKPSQEVGGIATLLEVGFGGLYSTCACLCVLHVFTRVYMCTCMCFTRIRAHSQIYALERSLERGSFARPSKAPTPHKAWPLPRCCLLLSFLLCNSPARRMCLLLLESFLPHRYSCTPFLHELITIAHLYKSQGRVKPDGCKRSSCL